MGKFADFSKKHSKYMTVQYGETVEVIWTGEAKETVNKFGSPAMVFTFITSDGDKDYTISNGSIIRQFEDYKKDDILVIKRFQKDARPSMSITKKGDTPF